MAQRTIPPAAAEDAGVGKVTTTVVVENADDVRRARRNEIPASAVRALALEEVLADTGATLLCLPEDVVESLGLTPIETVDVATATGRGTATLYEDARITVEGRTRDVTCLGLPAGRPPLLGVLAMEELGVEPDLQGQRLRVLPTRGPGTYLTVL